MHAALPEIRKILLDAGLREQFLTPTACGYFANEPEGRLYVGVKGDQLCVIIEPKGSLPSSKVFKGNPLETLRKEIDRI